MCKQRFTVIGLSDNRDIQLSENLKAIISRATVFSGGKRHHEIINHLLPYNHLWIDISVPLSGVFERYRKYSDIVVFASGDPLFYGFGGTLLREFPGSEIEVFPSFNSLQALAHRLVIPYQDMVNISVTGRPWKGLDDALICGYSLIGILTDRHKGPSQIAARMLEYGYDNYTMSVGESLGNDADERLLRYMHLQDVVSHEFSHPNCVILHRTHTRPHRLGIPEEEFCHLHNRPSMITKMPIRLLSLSMLGLGDKQTLWDIGFCTGSVSIEARLQFPHLQITSFERREECRALMLENCRRHGTPGIEMIIGDFFDLDHTNYGRPDAVFIGGHGGRLGEMIEIIFRHLQPGGVIVFNSVSEDSCRLFEQAVTSSGHEITGRHHITLDSHNPITILKAR